MDIKRLAEFLNAIQFCDRYSNEPVNLSDVRFTVLDQQLRPSIYKRVGFDSESVFPYYGDLMDKKAFAVWKRQFKTALLEILKNHPDYTSIQPEGQRYNGSTHFWRKRLV